MTGQVRDLLDWAGLDAERYDWDALGELPVRGSSFLHGPTVQARPEHFKPVGRWRDWSRRQRRIFEGEAGGRHGGPGLHLLMARA